MNNLFSKEHIFISEKQTQADVFEEVYLKLLKDGLVKAEFLENLLEREKNYPTGIDLSPVNDALPNIAIPHTESEYVNTTLIVPVKLINPIEFNNMLNSEQTLSVKFIFMILNDLKENQSIILASIMEFIASTPLDILQQLFSANSSEQIYSLLQNNFKQIS